MFHCKEQIFVIHLNDLLKFLTAILAVFVVDCWICQYYLVDAGLWLMRQHCTYSTVRLAGTGLPFQMKLEDNL